MSSVDLAALLTGNRRALAKAITLVESKLDRPRVEAQSILEQALPHAGRSVRIGITGVPGVGKSTFIETFGLYWLFVDIVWKRFTGIVSLSVLRQSGPNNGRGGRDLSDLYSVRHVNG